MSIRFSVLASGSRGNAAVVRAGGASLLIDVGLGPRAMAGRLAAAGMRWGEVGGALLTHTHGDHLNDATLRYMARMGVCLHCHEGHPPALDRHSGFRELGRRGLIRTYDDRPFLAPNGLRVEPLTLKHDAGPTYGFRVEGREGRQRPASVGYLADTGCWTEALADALTDIDLLAVEFNHDVEMQRNSGRSPYLIARNLGDRGHLSNAQGARLIESVLRRSGPSSLRHLVLLHLSEQCNRPEIAWAEAWKALRTFDRRSNVHVARQEAVSPQMAVKAAPRRRAVVAASLFPWEAA